MYFFTSFRPQGGGGVKKKYDLLFFYYYYIMNIFSRYDDITDLLGDTIHVSLSADNLSELDQDGILEL